MVTFHVEIDLKPEFDPCERGICKIGLLRAGANRVVQLPADYVGDATLSAFVLLAAPRMIPLR
jgi:hypothetical protein